MFAKSLIVFCIATFYVTNAQITGWTKPLITGDSGTGASPISFAENQATGATSNSVTATPSSPDTIASYTLITTGTPFSVVSDTGVLNLDSALDYETTSSYTLVIEAVDTNDTPNTGTATVSITVTDVNEAPTFSATSYQACATHGATEGTSVTSVTATDQDAGDTIAYSINAGNTNDDFSFASNTLQVATGQTLTTATATYSLTIHAVDNDDPQLTGTTTYTVTVQSGACSGATALVVSIMTILMALIVSLN